MMCFGVILPIFLALFAVFGLYQVMVLIGETWFGSNNISVCIYVDTAEVLRNFDTYLREAHRKPMARSGGVVVWIASPFATESFLNRLRRENILFVVFDMEKTAG